MLQVAIIQGGRTLRQIVHQGQTFVQAPPTGEYKIQVRNNSGRSRLVLLSVDGVNVVDGKDASLEGDSGYVIRPWQTLDVPGWRRSDSEVAAFEFAEQTGSYANQTGRGTKNVGVIGIAMFEEQAPTHILRSTQFGGGLKGMIPTPPDTFIGNRWSNGHDHDESNVSTRGATTLNGNGRGVMDMAEAAPAVVMNVQTAAPVDVGTGYGAQATFHTTEVAFQKASNVPSLVLVLRYATIERLKSWGVPVEAPPTAQAFPASAQSVPAPAGWQPR